MLLRGQAIEVPTVAYSQHQTLLSILYLIRDSLSQSLGKFRVTAGNVPPKRHVLLVGLLKKGFKSIHYT
jgi:hypothetical protein